ncbi:MAG: ABC transporter substrate-binding protein [Cyclobacteriaceae bacterium]|nr:ABC transporter substrate-binding protein [Cyclobacteriaceae bacterium]
MKLGFKWWAVITLVLASFNARSEEQSPQAFFEQQLFEVFSELRARPEYYQSLDTLVPLAESYIINHWDIEATLLALVGRTQWEPLTQAQKLALQQAFRETMLRYFIEAYAYYDDQPVTLTEVALNESGDKGWLRIAIEIEYAPDIPIDISIAKHDGQWKFRDIRFQGIRYTYMKRDYYQTTLQESGIDALVAELDSKNKQFFHALKQLSNPAAPTVEMSHQ